MGKEMSMLVLKVNQPQIHLEEVKSSRRVMFSYSVVQFTEICVPMPIGFHLCAFTRWVHALQLDISG